MRIVEQKTCTYINNKSGDFVACRSSWNKGIWLETEIFSLILDPNWVAVIYCTDCLHSWVRDCRCEMNQIYWKHRENSIKLGKFQSTRILSRSSPMGTEECKNSPDTVAVNTFVQSDRVSTHNTKETDSSRILIDSHHAEQTDALSCFASVHSTYHFSFLTTCPFLLDPLPSWCESKINRNLQSFLCEWNAPSQVYIF